MHPLAIPSARRVRSPPRHMLLTGQINREINRIDASVSHPPSAPNSSGLGLFSYPSERHISSNNVLMAWPAYLVDALQRSVLFLDLLRQLGNQQTDIASQPMATALHFENEVPISGKLLPRPINYILSRIVPSPGIEIDASKHSVIQLRRVLSQQFKRHRHLAMSVAS